MAGYNILYGSQNKFETRDRAGRESSKGIERHKASLSRHRSAHRHPQIAEDYQSWTRRHPRWRM